MSAHAVDQDERFAVTAFDDSVPSAPALDDPDLRAEQSVATDFPSDSGLHVTALESSRISMGKDKLTRSGRWNHCVPGDGTPPGGGTRTVRRRSQVRSARWNILLRPL